MTFLIVCPLVFIAGFIDSIAGGGGIISLPAYLFAGLPMHAALATNKLSSFCGSTIATGRYLKNGYVCKKFIIPTVLCSLAGSAIGARISLLTSDFILKRMLLIVLPIVACILFFRRNKEDNHTLLTDNTINKFHILIASIAAFAIGMYDGFYGPGTGTFLMIIFTSVLHLDSRNAAGNTKCVNWASNIAALVTFMTSGNVMYQLGIAAALCNMAGNYVGSGLVIKNGTKFVRPMIIIVLILLFIKVLNER